MSRPRSDLLWLAAAALTWAAAAVGEETALARLDEEFRQRAAAIAARAEAARADRLAAVVRGWSIQMPGDRQVVFEIPARLEEPAGIDATTRPLWAEFVAARQARAAGTFVAAKAEAEAGRPCAVVELLHRTLRDDPDHERARLAAGYVRRGAHWMRPEAARRLDRGEEFDPAFGWQPRNRLARLRAGERPAGDRWIDAAEDAARTLAVADGRRFASDHWEILSAAPLEDAAALAAGLEETAHVWRQVFGGVALSANAWRAAVAGRGMPRPREPFAAVLCANRPQYVCELERVEPAVARTTAIYWRPTQTSWFCVDPPLGVPHATVLHESAHQLCAEATDTSPLAGERCGFWAIEAAACHLEATVRTDVGWTVGGPDAGRVPDARRLLVEEEFHVPLEELCRLGRAAMQDDPRLPRLYAEFAGLADFLMNGDGGRHREAFVAYLARIYAGTADTDTLAELCDTSCAELDAGYRRHLSR